MPVGMGSQGPLVAPASCSPCLWYSGDSDENAVGYNGLWNSNQTGLGLSGAVYVPFVPAPDGNPLHLHAAVTSVSFYIQADTTSTNPPPDYVNTTYEFRSKQVLSGSGGTLGKHGTCYSTTWNYVRTDIYGYNTYFLTCFFKTPIKVAVGTIGWVNILPTLNGSTMAYVVNVNDFPPANQLGWGDMEDDSFVNSSSFGYNFSPANGAGGVAFPQFSVAMAGTYVD